MLLYEMEVSPKMFFEDVGSQNKTKWRTYFHDDVVIKWHCTNER